MKILKGKRRIFFDQDRGSFGKHGYSRLSGQVVIQVAGWFDIKTFANAGGWSL